MAKILGVNPEAIKNLDEDTIVSAINNTFNDSSIENIYNKDVAITMEPSQSEKILYEKIIEDKDREIAFLRDLLSKK